MTGRPPGVAERGFRVRRPYDHCAKGGHTKPSSPAYVCADHKGTRGWFTHCAVCGQPFDWTPGRDYVHIECLAKTGAA